MQALVPATAKRQPIAKARVRFERRRDRGTPHGDPDNHRPPGFKTPVDRCVHGGLNRFSISLCTSHPA